MKTSYENSSDHYDLIMENVYLKSPKRLFEFFTFIKREYCDIEIRNILDLGCGTGTDAIYFAESGGYTVTGIDISDPMLRVARTKAARSEAEVKFVNANITQFDANDTYDCILSFGAFGHILESHEIEQTLKKVHAILNAKGLLILHQENIVGIAKSVRDREARFISGGYEYEVTLRYEVDVLKCLLIEEEHIKVSKKRKITFESTEHHVFRNWTYYEGMQFLRKAGFRQIHCFSSFSDREELTGKEIGLIFCCLK